MAFGRNYGNHSYTGRRLILYGLLWCVSAVVMGLSAWRIARFNRHDRIVSELLATSILTLIWVPIAMFLLMAVRAAGAVTGANRHAGRHPRWPHEQFGGWILWILWLVGAAILTNDFPTKASRGFGRPSRLLSTLIAFSWIAFGLLTIIGILAWMHHANTRGPVAAAGYGHHDGVMTDTSERTPATTTGTTRSTAPIV
ncbi:hypothetical protein AURDEDRAFT_113751 [Auricularia subglabra TFB-10046 SS5]|nr:hypothetical protein AURDEDRAFT_113751 [Auricularia subglabra TFB-10046 SS5]